MPPRYKQFYEQVVRADLLSKMQYKNFHQIPTVKQISVSGATRAALGKGLDQAVASAFMLELITGQQAKLTRIRRGNARYKSREGFLEGSKITLHGDQMWNFMDRFVTMVLPRITDFGGLKHSSFDGRGNYNIGIRDIHVFLEVEAQHGNMLNFNLNSARGCGIYIETSAKTDDEAQLLLSGLRFPFVRRKAQSAVATAVASGVELDGAAAEPGN
jgi:large subunit ribosomal protein L5